jgi:glycosyltransferase involved in cell wall biosynthesis
LKILHVVTLVSPDGAYGGPTRVAINQAAALVEREHDVTVVGAQRGFEDPPSYAGGVPLKLFPARRAVPRIGFAGLVSPGLLWWAREHLRYYDVVHVHLARDLITLPVALMALHFGVPLVAQTHGMVDRSSRVSARLLDVLATRRVLRTAHALLYLTPAERDELELVAKGPTRLSYLPNGVPATATRAQGDSEVLFLARLAERKRPIHFAQAAVQLNARHPELRFRIVGPDEGELNRVNRFIEEHDTVGYLSYEGSVSPARSLERMAEAALYVLPAVEEPYPMSVLEAMSVGLPVVVTDTCGLSDVVASSGSGIVTDGSVEQLIAAIAQFFEEPGRREAAGRNALATARERFGMASIARHLTTIYPARTVPGP